MLGLVQKMDKNIMGLSKHRNKPCHCGSGMKFKHCHLREHHRMQAQLVTPIAKQEHKKEQTYWKKRYKQVTGSKSD